MLASAEEAISINDSIAADRKTAEHFLLHYEKELANYNNAKDEFMNYREERDENIGGGRSGVGKPTEEKALREIAFERQYEGYRWLKAVEIVQRGLGERKNIFIRVRREAERNNLYAIGRGRKGWVVFAQRRYAEEIERRFIVAEVWIGERTLQSWWQDIINQTVFVANKINF